MRKGFMGMLEQLLSFGRVTASKQATSTQQVLVSIEGNEGEERPYQAMWGHAAIVFRPPADTEVIFSRMGDEMVPVASRDVRFGVSCEEGEVVIRNLTSDSPARVRLRADGEIVLEGATIRGVDAGDAAAIATKALALAEEVDGRLQSVRTAFNIHKHTGVTVGGGVSGVTDTLIGALATVASARFFSKD